MKQRKGKKFGVYEIDRDSMLQGRKKKSDQRKIKRIGHIRLRADMSSIVQLAIRTGKNSNLYNGKELYREKKIRRGQGGQGSQTRLSCCLLCFASSCCQRGTIVPPALNAAIEFAFSDSCLEMRWY